MISVFQKKEDCCGCTACQHTCPTKAIKMVTDSEGFKYPEIDQELCTDCGECRKVCVFQNDYNTSQGPEFPKVYAVKHVDVNVRMTSTSGGAFTALSDYILDKNGVVYGAAFDEEMNVVHKMASSKIKRDQFKGSKYVQSDLGNTYKEIEKLLKNRKIVLFTGTPCQTAGLNSYLNGIDKQNLFLCDLVCYGTPSPLMWKEHIKYLENKEKSKIVEYYCRSKVKGWHGHNEMVIYENGKKDYKSILSQKHKVLFHSRNILRPACYKCKYANLQRPSDITIGDFWGIEKCMPDFDDNKGVSLVLINSVKGQILFDNIKGSIVYRESNIKDCLQRTLQRPSEPSIKRKQFWEEYYSKGYKYIIKKYAGCNMNSRAKRLVKGMLQRIGLL